MLIHLVSAAGQPILRCILFSVRLRWEMILDCDLDSLGDSSCKKSLPWGCNSLRTWDRVSLITGVAWRT